MSRLLTVILLVLPLFRDASRVYIWQKNLPGMTLSRGVSRDKNKKGTTPIMVKIKGGRYSDSKFSILNVNSARRPGQMYSYYIGKFEVTVGEFAAFVIETGYITDAEILGTNNIYSTSTNFLMPRNSIPGINWRHNPLGDLRPSSEYNHPVVHVSWNDAMAYCKWLSIKTHKQYRLPTEQEWEYAAGNRSDHTRYSWGNDTVFVSAANVADQSLMKGDPTNKSLKFYYCNDGYVYSAPVGRFTASKTRLYDMTGNVWEWCMDQHPNNPLPEPKLRMIRGGSWNTGPQYSCVTTSGNCVQSHSAFDLGFRVAMIP